MLHPREQKVGLDVMTAGRFYATSNCFRPESSNSDRFLLPVPEADPRKWVLGFGRRICPGKSENTLLPISAPTTNSGAHFAEISLMLNITSLLALFDGKGTTRVTIKSKFRLAVFVSLCIAPQRVFQF